ncbi:MAG: hypothetical protein ACLP8A_09840 [Methylovirgula sp.]
MSLAGALRDNRYPAVRPIRAWTSLFFILTLFCSLIGVLNQAQAQAIIATVNGNPITDLDLSQRMKLLKVLRKPATRDAAMESLIEDILKTQETSLYKIAPTDAQIGQQIVHVAADMKIAPEALFAEFQHAGVSDTHVKEHFSAEVAFLGLVDAFHKGVEASEAQIRAELAKEESHASNTEYRIHQVIFVLPSGVTGAKAIEAIKGRIAAAEQLRTRFTDCGSGLPLARSMDNVAVKDEIVSNSSRLTQQLRQLFDKTPTGHLTPPQHTQEGVEMIAICSKTASHDDTALRTAISERLLAAEVKQDADRRLKELRARAVIVKR